MVSARHTISLRVKPSDTSSAPPPRCVAGVPALSSKRHRGSSRPDSAIGPRAPAIRSFTPTFSWRQPRPRPGRPLVSARGRRLYTHARSASFIYQAVLRSELTRTLGVDWTPVRKGIAEVVGIPRPVLRAFSRRRAEIDAALAQRGTSGARAAEAAALATRAAKEPRVAPETLLGVAHTGRRARLRTRHDPAHHRACPLRRARGPRLGRCVDGARRLDRLDPPKLDVLASGRHPVALRDAPTWSADRCSHARAGDRSLLELVPSGAAGSRRLHP